MDLELTSRSGKCNLIHAFCYFFRIKIIVYTDVHALVFIRQFPSLCICPCLKIRIQCLGFCNLIYRLEEVECHNTFICLLILNERLVNYKDGPLNAGSVCCAECYRKIVHLIVGLIFDRCS